MTRSLALIPLAAALAACVDVVSLQTAVAPGSELFEPRLVGTWELRQDTSLSGRLVITRESASQYLVRDLEEQGPSAVFMGRLGALGAGRLLFELSPVGDTSKYTHPLSGSDSTRLNPPDYPLMLPVRMPIVIERADTGLVFAVLNGDSLAAALKAGKVRTPFAMVSTGDLSTTLLLTEQESQRLNAALRALADRPGALIPLPRVGHRIGLPSLH